MHILYRSAKYLIFNVKIQNLAAIFFHKFKKIDKKLSAKFSSTKFHGKILKNVEALAFYLSDGE